MLRLFVLMLSIGLADSLNPSTIGPALYLATGERARNQVAGFTLGVFSTYLLGGALIALGPGQLIRSAFDLDVRQTIRFSAEVVAGVVLLFSAWLIWQRRDRMLARGLPGTAPRKRSGALLGASIIVVELPTAFPYFAAIAAILGSGLGVVRGLVLLLVFNICFILPLLALLAVLTFGGKRTDRILCDVRSFLQRRWPHLLAGLIGLVGIVALFFGITGLVSGVHGRFGHFVGHVRKLLHP